MTTKIESGAVKRTSIRLPNWNEVGYLMQGCAIGLVIGQSLSILSVNPITLSMIFFGLIVAGGLFIQSSK